MLHITLCVYSVQLISWDYQEPAAASISSNIRIYNKHVFRPSLPVLVELLKHLECLK